MMLTPLGTVIGSGVPTLATSAGPSAVTMGAIVLGLLALTALVIVVGHRRRRS
jgi:hypothetical protein